MECTWLRAGCWVLPAGCWLCTQCPACWLLGCTGLHWMHWLCPPVNKRWRVRAGQYCARPRCWRMAPSSHPLSPLPPAAPCAPACRELRHHSKAAFRVFNFMSPIFTSERRLHARFCTDAAWRQPWMPCCCADAACRQHCRPGGGCGSLHTFTLPSLRPAVAFVGVRSVLAPPVVAWFVYSLWFRWGAAATA